MKERISHRVEIAKLRAALSGEIPKTHIEKAVSCIGTMSPVASAIIALVAVIILWNTFDLRVESQSLDTFAEFGRMLADAQQEYCESDGEEITYDYKLKIDRILKLLPLVEGHLTSGDWTALATISWNVCDMSRRLQFVQEAVESGSSTQDLYAAYVTRAHVLYEQSLEASDGKTRASLREDADLCFSKAIDKAEESPNVAINNFLRVEALRVWVQCLRASGKETRAIELAIERDRIWGTFKSKDQRVRLASYDDEKFSEACIPRPKCPAELALIPRDVRLCLISFETDEAKALREAQPVPKGEHSVLIPEDSDPGPLLGSTEIESSLDPGSQASHLRLQELEQELRELQAKYLELQPNRVDSVQFEQKVPVYHLLVHNTSNYRQHPIINGEVYEAIQSGQVLKYSIPYSRRLTVRRRGSRQARTYNTSGYWEEGHVQTKVPVFRITSCCLKFLRVVNK